MIKECRLKYGSSVLQTWRKEDFFVFHNTYYDDAAQLREDVNAVGNVVPAKRTWMARRPLKFKARLHNIFFGDDYSKAFQVQGASQKLSLEFDLEQDRALIQTDGVTNNIFLADPSQYFSSLVLQVEMYHVLRRERDQGVALYSNPRGMRLLMDDTQVRFESIWKYLEKWTMANNLCSGTLALASTAPSCWTAQRFRSKSRTSTCPPSSCVL